jgi:predicted DNA-binding protein (MmcQ/YjbR family)
MHIDRLRKLCLSFPGVTEQIQWVDHLLFKVGGKMFAITSLEPSPVWLCFKTAPESFADLTERPGIIPAPYLAKAKWVGLESRDALGSSELEQLLRDSYELIRAKLPRKIQERLAGAKPAPTAPKRNLRLKKTRRTRPPSRKR